MKIGFVSLGCPKNQLDTEVMLHEVAEAGYELTAEETEADIVIINTCAFIESAKKESIENILDIAWLKEQPLLKAILCGHCHSFYEERFSPTAMQYTVEAGYKGGAYEIEFVEYNIGVISEIGVIYGTYNT